MFKNESSLGLSAEFNILEALFADADDYSANPEYRKYVHTLDPDSRKLIRAFDETERNWLDSGCSSFHSICNPSPLVAPNNEVDTGSSGGVGSPTHLTRIAWMRCAAATMR